MKELIMMYNTPEIQSKMTMKFGTCFATKSTSSNVEHFLEKYPDRWLKVDDCLYFLSWITGNNNGTKWPVLAVAGEIIFIPRIEDVLEWVGDKAHCLVRLSDAEIDMEEIKEKRVRWLLNGYDDCGHAYDISYADSPIKALLKAYMHLSHNKTWNGEEWV